MKQSERIQELQRMHQNYVVLEQVATREEDKKNFRYGRELALALLASALGIATITFM